MNARSSPAIGVPGSGHEPARRRVHARGFREHCGRQPAGTGREHSGQRRQTCQSLSILGDHSGDTFGTVKNLSVVVSALRDSTDLMKQLDENLSSVTGTLSDDPDDVGNAADALFGTTPTALRPSQWCMAA